MTWISKKELAKFLGKSERGAAWFVQTRGIRVRRNPINWAMVQYCKEDVERALQGDDRVEPQKVQV